MLRKASVGRVKQKQLVRFLPHNNHLGFWLIVCFFEVIKVGWLHSAASCKSQTVIPKLAYQRSQCWQPESRCDFEMKKMWKSPSWKATTDLTLALSVCRPAVVWLLWRREPWCIFSSSLPSALENVVILCIDYWARTLFWPCTIGTQLLPLPFTGILAFANWLTATPVNDLHIPQGLDSLLIFPSDRTTLYPLMGYSFTPLFGFIDWMLDWISFESRAFSSRVKAPLFSEPNWLCVFLTVNHAQR